MPVVRCARAASYGQPKLGSRFAVFQSRRWHHVGYRDRCSVFWIPPTRYHGKKNPEENGEDFNSLLVRGGFIQQAYSGLFHLLPLGLRVQGKIERLLEKHMQTLQASKVSLSSLSSQELWSRSGRLETGVDVFKFEDRKDAKWLLSPTHEEEISLLVGNSVQSYRDLPVKLYQISRKYRDEPRPRQGLLRGREFLMKDLYTFDADIPNALRSYDQVREVYARFFDELKMPYMVAKAHSGNMGGELSHEYHLPSSKGEDSIISCSHCDYVSNEELVKSTSLTIQPLSSVDLSQSGATNERVPLKEAIFLTHDTKTLVKTYCQNRDRHSQGSGPDRSINPYAVRAVVPNVALGIEDPLLRFPAARGQAASLLYIFDDEIEWRDIQAKLAAEEELNKHDGLHMYVGTGTSGSLGVPGLAKPKTGDQCPACSEGRMLVQNAIEIGHTFYLGTRYSKALNVKFAVDPGSMSEGESFAQMGCHGIGVSRLIAAAAAILSDARGLNWPRVLAPFEVVIIPHRSADTQACDTVYDNLAQEGKACNDAIVDDREMDWLSKLRDADLVGYPVIVFLGTAWRERGEYEVQCRRLELKRNVPAADLADFVQGLLARL